MCGVYKNVNKLEMCENTAKQKPDGEWIPRGHE